MLTAYVTVAPVLARCAGRFADLIVTGPDPAQMAALRAAETIGRPLGAESFLDKIGTLTGRDARPAKRGAKEKGDLVKCDCNLTSEQKANCDRD